VVADATDVWGWCSDEEPDHFREIGQLRDVLNTIAAQPMVAAAAVASPRRFAEMIAVAHGFSRVFYAGSFAVSLALEAHIPDPKRFCSIEIVQQSLKFHAYRSLELFGEQHEPAGVYCVSFSLMDFVIQRRVLVAEYPE